MTNQLKRWEFVFVPSFNLITIDIILRALILSFSFLKDDFGHYQLSLLTVLNVITSVIIFNVARRNRKAIEAFLEMRLISESINIIDQKIGYNQVNVQTRLWKLRSNYKLVGIFLFSPFLVALPLLFSETDSLNLNILLFTLGFIIQGCFLFFYRDNFISKKIISIKLNGEKYNPGKRDEVIKFLNRNSVRNAMKYLSDANDIIILDLQTKIKIYRERLENISFEAIFLGALTFATFGQLIGSLDNKLSVFINECLYKNKILNDLTFNEKELLSLIILGSLLSSVFYVVLLLKRFAILKSIEFAQLKIELANSWNAREEYHVVNIDESNINAMKFTEQIQIELSNANKICSEIYSNLNILTFMRLLGLGSFFFVLLVSAKLLHPDIFLIVLIITIYGIIITLLLNKTHLELRGIIPKRWSVLLSKSKNFQHTLSKKEEVN